MRLTNHYRVLGAFMVALAACGTAADSGQEVLDFDQIAETGAEIESDSSGTTATLRVTTTIDAVCAVAFGETESLGRLATDQDMDAAGHADHEVILGGLEPDTEYFYRLQGVGVDGGLYQSEMLTFRTSPASGDMPGRNTAVDAEVIEVSSKFSDAFAAANAIDGDVATEWSTAGDGDDAYLVLDLGYEAEVVAVGFHTRTMADGSATTETFTVTVDDTDTYGPFNVGRADIDVAGRIIRFDVDMSSGGNTGATEIEVFERP